MVRSLVTLLASVLSISVLLAQQQPADRVYTNGVVFTADAQHSAASAVAIQGGRIIYIGDDKGAQPFVGKNTKLTDLQGRFLMPGLIDGHMHPLEAGLKLQKCSLNYEPLTVEEMQKRIQACLDKTKQQEPDTWLEVVYWFQEGMLPAGVKTSRATLDALQTKRPIFVQSSFGHTALVNSRALALAKITKDTPDPLGGKIWHDADGNPTGLLEDAAQDFCSKLLPEPTAQENLAAARIALRTMNAQGVTTFLDADAPDESMVAFTEVQKSGELTARGHFAPQIHPEEAGDPAKAVAKIVAYAKKYDQGAPKMEPGITVRNAKLYLDGVIAAPALTGNMLAPYRVNAGTAEKPNWVAGKSRGPDLYFQAKPLAEILIGLARNGIDPHMHVDGDGAVNAALNGIQAMRAATGSADTRPALAHCEIVGPADFPRFKALNAIPVLSFQWEKPAGDTIGLTNYFGPERMKILEPAGLLANAGARVVFGSDWPVDALDEWFALKVGVTRRNAPSAGPEFKGKLGEDPGLSPEQALRAATIDAAYELHQEHETGSLEVGKFADVIVLDRNPLKDAPDDIANVKVLETVVGGKTVYEAKQ